MTTRFAYTAPVWSGVSVAGIRKATRKFVAYLGILVDAFIEARSMARVAQSRRIFIEE